MIAASPTSRQGSGIRRAAWIALLATSLAGACSARPQTDARLSGGGDRSAGREPASASPSAESSANGSQDSDRFTPPSRVPRRPRRIAESLTAVHWALNDEVGSWLREGEPLTRATKHRFAILSLYQQKVYRRLARRPRAGRRVVRLVPGWVRPAARNNFFAGRALFKSVTPVKPPVRMKTYRPEPPKRLLKYHRASHRRYRVPWKVLAAINLIETRFGRLMGPSSAGALGPMQFLPSTWRQYGNGGNIRDARDSIMAAGRYLRAHGGRRHIRRAVYAYNHSDEYVRAVLRYARTMKRNPKTFFSYYFWQVFVRTTKGDLQLTGPGADR